MKHVCIPDFSQPVPVRITASGKPVRASVDRRYRQFPDAAQPGAIEPWKAAYPVRPDTAHSRSLRFLDAAVEVLAAVAIIGGGIVLTGLASLSLSLPRNRAGRSPAPSSEDPEMPFRLSLKKLIRLDPTSRLRDRADGLRGSLAGQTRRTVVAATAATAAAAVPLPALAKPATAATPLPTERAEYRARLLAAYEEDRLRRPISGRVEGGDLEEAAALLVGVRLWQTAREILALPPPSTIDGLVLTALAAMVLTEGDYSESDPEILAAVSLTRAVMILTGTPYPAGFVGFGDEPDHEERDAAVYSGTGSLPAWAIEQARAERLARAARTA